MTLAAGDFDGWAGQAVASIVGGLLGITATLLAIWLTRRADRRKTLDEAALRGAEEIAKSVGQFLLVWRDTPVILPDNWLKRLRDEEARANVAVAVYSAAIQDKELKAYIDKYPKTMDTLLKEGENLVNGYIALPDYANTEGHWRKAKPHLDIIDEAIGRAAIALVDVVNDWRSTLKFSDKSSGGDHVAALQSRRAELYPAVQSGVS